MAAPMRIVLREGFGSELLLQFVDALQDLLGKRSFVDPRQYKSKQRRRRIRFAGELQRQRETAEPGQCEAKIG